MKRTISKQAFAKACGTSKPTLYKWIEQDRDGIRAYVTEDGIDASIFDAAPWAERCKARPTVEPEADETDALRAALSEKEKELAELRTANAILTERIEGMKQLNDAQAVQIANLKQLADQAQRLQLAQLTALPAPRRTFKQWWDDVTRKHKHDTEQPEE